MARQLKLSTLSTTATIANGDIFHVVVNSGSTAVNKSISFSALASQLIAQRNLANTSQANAAAQINAFSLIEVAGSTSLVAGQANDVLRFQNGVGIAITTDGSANIQIAQANNTTIQKVIVANNGANVAQRHIVNFLKAGNTSTFDIRVQDDPAGDKTDVTLEVYDQELNDLTDVSIRPGATNGSIFFLNQANSTYATWDGTDFTSIDRVLPCAMQYQISYDLGTNTVNLDSLGATDTPTVYALSGTTFAFNIPTNVNLTIQDNATNDITDNIKHVASNGTYTTGTTNADAGTLYWQIPPDVSGTYKYVISAQAGAVTKIGDIVVKDIRSL